MVEMRARFAVHFGKHEKKCGARERRKKMTTELDECIAHARSIVCSLCGNSFCLARLSKFFFFCSFLLCVLCYVFICICSSGLIVAFWLERD